MAHNIFVEKTLEASFDKAEELCRLSQSLGGVNMVGYMKRFAVTFRKAKELLDQAHMGELSSFSAYAYSSDFAGIVKSSKASVGRGGVLEDLGAHVIDLALWFFGDLQVDSAKLESLNVLGSEDSACFSVRNSDGLEGRFDISWCRKECRMPESGIIIRGTKGIMTVNDDTVKLELDDVESRRWYRHDLNDNVGFLLGAPEYYRENECFIESVLNGRNAEPSFYSASKVDYVIDQIKNKTTRERSRNEDL
jgi:predicted dehydrogenase